MGIAIQITHVLTTGLAFAEIYVIKNPSILVITDVKPVLNSIAMNCVPNSFLFIVIL